MSSTNFILLIYWIKTEAIKTAYATQDVHGRCESFLSDQQKMSLQKNDLSEKLE